jgi:hypothetical protein
MRRLGCTAKRSFRAPGDHHPEAAFHLELIFWVTETQRQMSSRDKQTAARYDKALDKALQTAGIIERVTKAGGKATFLRDEQKLWNKLGLLVHASKSSYFHASAGLAFNWRAIVEVLGD